jgi:hypothetical protein
VLAVRLDGWFVGDHSLLRDLGLMSSTYIMVGDYLPLRDFVPYGVIFMTMCFLF